MKKFFIINLFLLYALSSFSQMKDYRRWSLTFDMGVNSFDGDVHQSYNDIFPNSVVKTSFAISTELTLTPYWGIGAELNYLPLAGEDPAKRFEANVYEFAPYLSLNLLNLCNDNNHSKWNIYATAGGGFSYYNSTLYKKGTVFDKITNGWAATVPIGGLIEYNFSQLFAIGLKAQYRVHNKDNFEGTNLQETLGGYNYKGVTNDNLVNGSLSLRWKIGAQTKKHVRNNETRVTLKDALAMVDEANKKIESLSQEVTKLKSDIEPGADDDGDGVPNSRDLEPNTPKGLYIDYNGRGIRGLRIMPGTQEINPEDLRYLGASGNDRDNDGVPDNRDVEPRTPKNSEVDFWGRRVSRNENYIFASVYFEFDRWDLDCDAYKPIDLVAEKLNSDPTLLVEIRGYADYVGSNEYNKRLSQKRADRVKQELTCRYNIEPNRIIANGKGKIPIPPMAYRMNRRCDFIFSK